MTVHPNFVWVDMMATGVRGHDPRPLVTHVTTVDSMHTSLTLVCRRCGPTTLKLSKLPVGSILMTYTWASSAVISCCIL